MEYGHIILSMAQLSRYLGSYYFSTHLYNCLGYNIDRVFPLFIFHNDWVCFNYPFIKPFFYGFLLEKY